MSTPASQLMLRHTRFLARKTTIRHASTTAEATQAASDTVAKSKEIAAKVTSKASDGLTRVQSTPILGRVARGINRTVGAIGGQAGRLITFGTSLVPPTIYYSRVGFELGKLVYRGQKMSLPTGETLTPLLSAIWSPINSYVVNPVYRIFRSPLSSFTIIRETASSIRGSGISSRIYRILGQIRNIGRPQLISGGVIFAEVLGFFTVGEIIGRQKIIGYKGEVEHGEHH